LPAEGEELARQGGGALRRAPDLLHVATPGIVAVECLEQQIGIAVNRRQDVVEVVGDAAGQPPHRFHLVRLPQPGLRGAKRLLRLDALGHVPGIDHHALAWIVLDPAPERLEHPPAAVLVSEAEVQGRIDNPRQR
jgi:hypothetical protein